MFTSVFWDTGQLIFTPSENIWRRIQQDLNEHKTRRVSNNRTESPFKTLRARFTHSANHTSRWITLAGLPGTSSSFTLWYGWSLVRTVSLGLTTRVQGASVFSSNVMCLPWVRQKQPTGRHGAHEWGCQAAKQKRALFDSVTQWKKSRLYIINNFPKSEIRTLRVTEKETENSKWLLEWAEIQEGQIRKLTCRNQRGKGLRAT